MGQRSNSCKCCGCVIFEEDYSDNPASPWDVRTGNITPIAAGEWELSAGTLAVVTTPALIVSGYVTAMVQFDFAALDGEEAGIVFGYADDDNYNFVLVRGLFTPPGGGGFGGVLYVELEYWERRAGSDVLIKQWTFQQVDDGIKFNKLLQLCWQLGDATIETLLRVGINMGTLDDEPHVGVSSMPGGGYGVISAGDPVSLINVVTGFSAQKNTGDCLCGCYAPGAEPHSPPELILTLHGIDSPCMPFAEGVSLVIECADGQGAPHWIRPVSPPSRWDAEIVAGSPDVLRIRWHKSGSTLAVWEKELAGSPTPLWCLSELITVAHLVSNNTGCDLSALTISIAPEAVTGIAPTCP